MKINKNKTRKPKNKEQKPCVDAWIYEFNFKILHKKAKQANLLQQHGASKVSFQAFLF